MLVQGFNPIATLASAKCPRCHAVGLVEIDSLEYGDTPLVNKHQAAPYTSPGVPAKCPACALVLEWSGGFSE